MNPFIPLIIAAAFASSVQAEPEWESVDAAGNPLVYNYEVPPGGELLRACLCSAPHGTERICQCTQPAPTLAEAMELPRVWERQVLRGSPAVLPQGPDVPALRFAWQP